MRKLLSLVAAIGLVATPAVADLAPTGYSNPIEATMGSLPIGHTIGVYGYSTGGQAVIYQDFKITAVTSDLINLTFAFHWPYVTAVNGVQFQSGFAYDNSELAVVSMNPPAAGPFSLGGFNNYPGATTWASAFNPSSGTIQVGDALGTGVPLAINPGTLATGSQTPINGSVVYPFMNVSMHVKSVNPDSFLDAFIASGAVLFNFFTTVHTSFSGTFTTPTSLVYYTGGNIGAYSYGMGVIPEPASLSMLALGTLAIGGGIWRRRRR